jgi:hypothetical protein
MAKLSRNWKKAPMTDRPGQYRFFLLACVLFCLTLSLSAHAEPGLPESFSITYVLTKGPLELAQMTRRLYKNDNGHYVYDSFSEPIGYARWFTDVTLREKSEWVFHNNQLRPLFYSYDRKGDDRDRHVHLRFDWDKMRVINTINNTPWTMSIPDGTLDKLLYHLAVMYDLERGKKSLSYDIADGGKLKHYNFINHGEESLETDMGTLRTLKIELRGKKRDTVIWCAIDYNYLPVKLTQDDNGMTLMAKSFDGVERRAADGGKQSNAATALKSAAE